MKMKVGIRIIAADKGPGISNLKKVMEDGYSTSGGLGAGLPGVKRLMDTMDIQSTCREWYDNSYRKMGKVGCDKI